MRGFPLLGALIVVLLFGISWPILQATIGVAHRGESAGAPTSPSVARSAPPAEENEVVAIRLAATAAMESLLVEFLGQPLINAGATGGHVSKELDGVTFPPAGVDFWVQAEFRGMPERSAIALRIEIEDSSGEMYQQTLWAEEGESGIADSVFFSSLQPGGQP